MRVRVMLAVIIVLTMSIMVLFSIVSIIFTCVSTTLAFHRDR